MNLIQFSHFGKKGKTIVLFPGWTHPAQKEPKFIKELSEHFQIVSVDLPGYVQNPDSTRFCNFSRIAEEIHSKLQKNNTQPIAFIGFSMGCRLISTFNALHQNTIRNIFVGYPIETFNIPIWTHLLIQSDYLINILRSNTRFTQYCVNRALQNISEDSQVIFKPKYVSLKGAFDSLIGLLSSSVTLGPRENSSLFIYGEYDRYSKQAQQKNVQNIQLIKDAGHNCVPGNEEEIVEHIRSSVRLKSTR